MPKSKKQFEGEVPDYESYLEVETIDEAISGHKDVLYSKVKLQEDLKQQKRDMAKGYNDQIKILQEEVDYELGVISAFNDRKRVVAAGADVALPPPPTPSPDVVEMAAKIAAAKADATIDASLNGNGGAGYVPLPAVPFMKPSTP